MSELVDIDLVLTPITGDPVTLKGIGEINGPVNNVVVFDFQELITDFQTVLQNIAVTNVEHYRNRVRAYQVVFDPGGQFLSASYKETHPFDETLDSSTPERAHNGVVAITGQGNSPKSSSMRLTLYIAQYWRERGTGVTGSL